jgi:hypothetical protein
MKERANPSGRPSARWALVLAVVAIGVLSGLTNVFAFNRQATDDAIDEALNGEVASGGGSSGPYAPYDATVYLPSHPHFR